MSDLHGNLIHIQKCDLCLIAGDVVPLNIQKNRVESIVWLFQDFLPWIKELPCEEVYIWQQVITILYVLQNIQ